MTAWTKSARRRLPTSRKQRTASSANTKPARKSLGLQRTSLQGLEVANADESLALIRLALSGAPGDRAERARRVVALNAGAALYVAGLAANLADGVKEAGRLLESGTPWARVEALVDYTAGL